MLQPFKISALPSIQNYSACSLAHGLITSLTIDTFQLDGFHKKNSIICIISVAYLFNPSDAELQLPKLSRECFLQTVVTS